eukprot:g963.t1
MGSWQGQVAISSLVLSAAAIACYSDLLLDADRGWVYDDSLNFVDQAARLSQLSYANVQWAFSADGIVIGVYEPVAMIGKMVSASLLGRTPSSFVKANLALHVLNVAMAYGISRQLVRIEGAKRDFSLVSALLACCSPLRAEVVCWASCQPFLLAAAFSQIAWAFKLQRGNLWVAAALVAYTAACLCKAASITLPVLFVSFDFCQHLHLQQSRRSPEPKGRRTNRAAMIGAAAWAAVWENTCFVLLALPIFGCIYQATLVHEASVRALSPSELCLRACYALLYYPLKTFLPTELTVRVDLPDEALSVWTARFGVPAAVVALVMAVVVRIFVRFVSHKGTADADGGDGGDGADGADDDTAQQKAKGSSASRTIAAWPLLWCHYWLCYCGLLLPTLGLVSTHVWALAADRYSYIVGLTVMVPAFAHALDRLLPLLAIHAPALGPAIIPAALALDTARTALDDDDTGKGGKGGKGDGSGKGRGSSNKGVNKLRKKKEKAKEKAAGGGTIFTALVAAAVAALVMQTRAYCRVWRTDETLWRHTVAVNPHDPMAHHNLGKAIEQDIEATAAAAAAAVRRVGQVQGANAMRAAEAARNKQQAGRYDEAIASFTLAAKAQPVPRDYSTELCVALHKHSAGRQQEAVLMCQRVAKATPTDSVAISALAASAGETGAYGADDLLKLHSRVVQLRPMDAEGHFNRAVVLHTRGQPYSTQAIADYAKALALAPNSPRAVAACNNFGALLRGQGRVKEAEGLYQHALRQNPAHAKSHYNLGILYQAAGRNEEALARYERAGLLDPALQRRSK